MAKAMTTDELRDALDRLGITAEKLAEIIGTSPVTVRRWLMDPDKPTHRQVPPTAAKVIGWIIEGGRPKEWPPAPK
ncbi:helix-turn-helix transcriptional regulator [Shimia sp. R11_0]|uniref:HTH cro/C1-type domain-containing protein n=1 Tax=Shimia marina TaxID=321267 RepID=A0A0P1ER99_9RHOB|nr:MULTISPECIES: helix-turn-helix transcriptional regulator [Shimia]MBO9477558.1 helix-turn-helix transcriptional regulator [Shimia sp. R11_0]CUH53046.1 hypothetical protein SHM7688_02498 [Shimia marina]SFD93094.1 Helix-turn-helix [Shimia marina]